VSTASQRLARLLALVPYLLNRQGIPLAEAAHDVGVSEAQLEKDLELLFVCGLPGHMPDDLIEADWETGRVYVGNADTIARPLRLGVDEVLALLVGLRMLAALPGLQDRAALDRAITKLQRVAGGAAGPAGDHVAVEVDLAAEEAVLAAVRHALSQGRRLHLRYYVPGRDETTERDVDPMRVAIAEGRTYLEGWCHRAEAVRLFRLDRVVAVQELDVPAEVPPEAEPLDLDRGLFRPGPDDIVATIDLRPAARWVPEYYPCDETTELPDGGLRIRLRAPDEKWLCRLALRLGPTARVVGPPELAAAVRAEAAAALAAYPNRAVGT
jgi:predicted DNA-binding transcriptional regulator YafY